MADHTPTEGGHPDMDYAEHERTYQRFIAFTKWSTIALVVILLLMLVFLV